MEKQGDDVKMIARGGILWSPVVVDAIHHKYDEKHKNTA